MTTPLHPIVFTIIFSLTLWLAPLAASSQVNVNINLQPAWGPVEYDYVDYYYLPEYEVYYDVPHQQFVYFDGGRWRFGATLPRRYGMIDYYSTYKVVINEPRAYRGFHNHRLQYAQYKHGKHKQYLIRDSRSPKYSRENRPSTITPNGRAHGINAQGRAAYQGKSKGGGQGKGGRKH